MNIGQILFILSIKKEIIYFLKIIIFLKKEEKLLVQK